MPFEAALLAVNTDVQVVLFADTDLRAVEDAFRAAAEAQEDVAIVIEFASFDKGRNVRCEFADLQPGDVFREVFGMRPDVANATGGSALLRIGAPSGLLLSARLEARRE